MNVGNKLYIPIIHNGHPYHLVVQKEYPDKADSYWWVHDCNYVDPVQSRTGWGKTPDQAVRDFLMPITHPNPNL